MKRWTKILPVWLALALGVTLVAEATGLSVAYRRAERMAQRCLQQRAKEEQLSRLSPARTRENEQAMVREAARLRQDLAARRAILLSPRDGSPEETPALGSVEAYFDLAATTARLRAMAEAAKISVKPGEYFGFETYANKGPSGPSRDLVRRQCRAIEVILACLFRAQPEALLSIQRERNERDPASNDRATRDHFPMAPGLSLRRPDIWDTMAFRVEFRGETAALRRFLAALECAPEILVVRSIDAEPATAVFKTDGPGGGRGASLGPLVRPAPVQFAVTMETVSPVRPTPAGRP